MNAHNNVKIEHNDIKIEQNNIKSEQNNIKIEPIENTEQKTIAKGRRKVKKTKVTMDEKGYMVTTEYSSTEEVEYPIKREIPSIKKATHKKDNAVSTVKTGPKTQASLANFFGKK